MIPSFMKSSLLFYYIIYDYLIRRRRGRRKGREGEEGMGEKGKRKRKEEEMEARKKNNVFNYKKEIFLNHTNLLV